MRLAVFLLSYGGCGLSPKAPGTVGTLGAAATAAALLHFVPALAAEGPLLAACFVLAASAVTIVLTPVVEATEGKDPGVIVTDEVAGYWATLLLVPAPDLTHLAVAVFLFRLFDILKPWPAARLEALPSGWGVLLDDVAAGLYGAVALWGLDRLAAAF